MVSPDFDVTTKADSFKFICFKKPLIESWSIFSTKNILGNKSFI